MKKLMIALRIKLGGMTYEEYQDCLQRWKDLESYGSRRQYSRRRSSRPMSYVGLNDSTIDDIAKVLGRYAKHMSPGAKQLSSWEFDFLISVKDQLATKRRGLSPKQKPIVDRLLRKYPVDDYNPDTDGDRKLDSDEIRALARDLEGDDDV
jgi:hypothetical protein